VVEFEGAEHDTIMSCVSQGCAEPLQVGGPLREHRSPAGPVHFAGWAGQRPVGGELNPDHDEVHQQGVLGAQLSASGCHKLAACGPPIPGEQTAVMGGWD
jgi:hypothetical protein